MLVTGRARRIIRQLNVLLWRHAQRHPAPAFASSNVGASLIRESRRIRRHSPTAPNIVRCYPPATCFDILFLQPESARFRRASTTTYVRVVPSVGCDQLTQPIFADVGDQSCRSDAHVLARVDDKSPVWNRTTLGTISAPCTNRLVLCTCTSHFRAITPLLLESTVARSCSAQRHDQAMLPSRNLCPDPPWRKHAPSVRKQSSYRGKRTP
jgi:hypothetical protein